MQIISDEGVTDVQSQDAPAHDVRGLVTAVETKMTELMAWHEQQVKQLETDKTVLVAQVEQQREAFNAQYGSIESARHKLAQDVNYINQQRSTLLELTHKLHAEEATLARERADIQRERVLIQQQLKELADQRQHLHERAQGWLETTQDQLDQPIKLVGDIASAPHAPAASEEPDQPYQASLHIA